MKTIPPARLTRAPGGSSRGAFTRLELSFTLAALALLASLAGTGLAHTKPRADLTVCANNLRLIGRAEHIWAADHGDLFPWRVPSTSGGSQQAGLQNYAWFNYGLMANELGSPSLLACPSDAAKRVARSFSTSPDGGFFHALYQINAVSYFIGLDVNLNSPVWTSGTPLSAALGGDRHVKVDMLNVSCSSGITIASGFQTSPFSGAGWTNAIHGPTGNILGVDGHVSLVSSSRVAQAIAPAAADDNGTYHILPSR